MVFDLLGNKVSVTTTAIEGSNSMRIESSKHLAKGVYLVRINSNGEQETLRWIRQ
jgi:hypothetical protein